MHFPVAGRAHELADRQAAALLPQVNDKLQVAGHHNVFAIGDATDIKEVKLGYLADMQASLAHNPQTFILQTDCGAHVMQRGGAEPRIASLKDC